MTVVVAPLPSTLGATVTGVRLASLGLDEWAAVLDAFHRHAVLVFPAQHLSEAEQVAFAQRFGAIEHVAGPDPVATIANVRGDGTLRGDDDPVMQILHGNEGWHTDSSYMPVSAKASVLSAHVVPPDGGETEWADMRAAYDALDDALRSRVDDLCAQHSIRWSQARLGYSFDGYRGYGAAVDDAPLRPLVKVHPVTGRRALFIGRHAHAIPGLAAEESERLLDALLADACREPRTYRHRWTPGDVAVWDNRCVLHRARPYDHRHMRVMKHTRVAGDPITESSLALRS